MSLKMIATFALNCHPYFHIVTLTVQILREPMPSLPHSLHDQDVLMLPGTHSNGFKHRPCPVTRMN